jgi:hypothetical protein
VFLLLAGFHRCHEHTWNAHICCAIAEALDTYTQELQRFSEQLDKDLVDRVGKCMDLINTTAFEVACVMQLRKPLAIDRHNGCKKYLRVYAGIPPSKIQDTLYAEVMRVAASTPAELEIEQKGSPKVAATKSTKSSKAPSVVSAPASRVSRMSDEGSAPKRARRTAP